MSGGGGETNTVSKFEPPEWAAEKFPEYLNQAWSLTQDALPRYQGQVVAPMTQQHMTGQNMLANLAVNGSPVGKAANSMAYNTLMGGFDNPYATTLNPFGGESRYVSDVINNANKKTTDAYGQALAANDRGHAMSRTMGSDKQMLQQQNAQQALAEGLSNNALNALNQNFYASQGVAENQLNRATGAVDAERNRQMQAAGFAPQSQGMDLQAIQALLAGGDMQRNYQQDLLNVGAQDFYNWQQDPFVRLDTRGSALTRASGGAGTTSSQVMGGMHPLQGLLGGGMLAASMFGGGQ